MDKYVSGSTYRIFVNPALGCPAECSYCYLPTQEIELGSKTLVIVPLQWLIDEVLACGLFEPGKNGSIISIGCFTECWDLNTKPITLGLIEYFLELGNFVQFATKRYVNVFDLSRAISLIKSKGQLTAFISCSTFRFANEYEKGATTPAKRLSCIESLEEGGVPAYLYIKPVLQGVTLLDLDIFRQYVGGVSSGVVVGSTFIEKKEAVNETPLPLRGLTILEIDDETVIRDELVKICKVYKTSTEAIEKWRCIDG